MSIEDEGWLDAFYAVHPENQHRFGQLLSLFQEAAIPVGCFAGSGISKPYDMPTWHEFLETAARQMDLAEAAAPLLASWQYPAAAQLLHDYDEERFEDIIRNIFSHKHIVPELLGGGAVLPYLPFEYLITTNFDYVLESIYQLAGMTPKPVIYGSDTAFAKKARMEKLLPLLKIHGDYLHDRILTQEQYARSYFEGSPLMQHLDELFATISFVFVGFSLQDADIKAALHRACLRPDALPQFAILFADSPEDALARDAEFVRHGVLPIWYTCSHRHVGKILGLLVMLLRKDVAFEFIGISLKHGQALDGVLPVCEQLLRERPRCTATKMAYATCLAYSIDFEKIDDINYVHQVMSRIDRAIGSVNSFPDAYAVRAMVNHFRFQIDQAFEDISMAIEQDSSVKEQFRVQRGMYYLTLKQDKTRAREDLATALVNLPPTDSLVPWLKFYVAFIELNMGDPTALPRLREVLHNGSLESEGMQSTLRQMRMLLSLAEWLHRWGLLNFFLNSSSRFSDWLSVKFTTLLLWAGRAGLLRRFLREKPHFFRLLMITKNVPGIIKKMKK